jgi:hypothetical protein
MHHAVNLELHLELQARVDLSLYRSNERFSFVYFNHLTPSSEYFKEFKNIFLLLPLSILEKMDAFVLVKPSFYLKALNYLAISKTGSLFNKSYFTVENCH